MSGVWQYYNNCAVSNCLMTKDTFTNMKLVLEHVVIQMDAHPRKSLRVWGCVPYLTIIQ